MSPIFLGKTIFIALLNEHINIIDVSIKAIKTAVLKKIGDIFASCMCNVD